MRELVAALRSPFLAAGTGIAAARERPLLPLRLEEVQFSAGGRTILDRVTLTLGPAGLTVLLGPNGAGKSVLLRLVNGLLVPSSGRIRWGAEEPGPAVRRRQALVFQSPALLRRSELANVAFAVRLRGGGNVRARAMAALEEAGLAALAGRPARVLSGGEQQRLALARALVGSPEVLLLDEPTASLDPASVAKLEGMITEAVRQGTRVILVTHDIAQARRLADEVVFMARGRVTERTASADFFTRPASPEARAYLAGQLVL